MEVVKSCSSSTSVELLPAYTMNDELGVHQAVMDSDPQCMIELVLSFLPFNAGELEAACMDFYELISGTPFRAEVLGDGVLRLYCEPRAAWPVSAHLDTRAIRAFAEFSDAVHSLLKLRKEKADLVKKFEGLKNEC